MSIDEEKKLYLGDNHFLVEQSFNNRSGKFRYKGSNRLFKEIKSFYEDVLKTEFIPKKVIRDFRFHQGTGEFTGTCSGGYCVEEEFIGGDYSGQLYNVFCAYSNLKNKLDVPLKQRVERLNDAINHFNKCSSIECRKQLNIEKIPLYNAGKEGIEKKKIEIPKKNKSKEGNER
ncbi:MULTISPECIES: hypothetical protein [unclassified Fusobacterium]|uniref:hypothetical protein n=1 Tax=unclassified Fusobacterium TaxID=2648384 RepID=UPI001B8BF52F|nr:MULTISPECIES: hypothetical protein [unclassified Fusobacterium]MBR8701048.1 hypothetical protein [Fusobacterium sp. DD45]MBR8710820.1 hypothetical protein [Fusobacterium sp. DD28]MBR8751402.1 hypothetical protein [Fusobacterium sp. DD26]